MINFIGFGIIGCGGISVDHLDAIKAIEGTQIVAVCDVAIERAKQMAEKYGCDYYSDVNEMLKRDDINIINICTPSNMHRDSCVLAARAGKHVLTEKPIGISLDDADDMIKACKDAGVYLGCIYQLRYGTDITKLKKAVDEGRLGKIYFGAAHTKGYRAKEYYDSAPYRGKWSFDGGGALMIQAIHYIDLLQYVAGPVEEVSAYCTLIGHENIEVEDLGVASIKFQNGALGLIEGTTVAYPGLGTRLDIYGSKGSVIIENNNIKEWKLIDGEEIEPANETIDGYHERQIRDFIDCIKKKKEYSLSGESARQSLAIVLAIYESAKEGMPIKVRY